MLFMTSHSDSVYMRAAMYNQQYYGRFINPTKYNMDCALWNNWCADNGAFTGFDKNVFFKALERLFPYRKTCRFVVIPDVPFNWKETIEKFPKWNKTIRGMGFPTALAVQDGATIDNIPWDDFDCLFIGGSTEWKRSQYKIIKFPKSKKKVDDFTDLPLFRLKPVQIQQFNIVPQLIVEAKKRGKWVHMGRQANSIKQLWSAQKWGADSIDGTGETKRPDEYFKKFAQAMWEINNQKLVKARINKRAA